MLYVVYMYIHDHADLTQTSRSCAITYGLVRVAYGLLWEGRDWGRTPINPSPVSGHTSSGLASLPNSR